MFNRISMPILRKPDLEQENFFLNSAPLILKSSCRYLPILAREFSKF